MNFIKLLVRGVVIILAIPVFVLLSIIYVIGTAADLVIALILATCSWSFSNDSDETTFWGEFEHQAIRLNADFWND